MRYIRTEDGCILEKGKVLHNISKAYGVKDIKQANTIEDLCDMFVGYIEINGSKEDLSIKMSDDLNDFNAIDRLMFVKEGGLYGAIWTEWGLKYVAKMNDKGELELI